MRPSRMLRLSRRGIKTAGTYCEPHPETAMTATNINGLGGFLHL